MGMGVTPASNKHQRYYNAARFYWRKYNWENMTWLCNTYLTHCHTLNLLILSNVDRIACYRDHRMKEPSRLQPESAGLKPDCMNKQAPIRFGWCRHNLLAGNFKGPAYKQLSVLEECNWHKHATVQLDTWRSYCTNGVQLKVKFNIYPTISFLVSSLIWSRAIAKLFIFTAEWSQTVNRLR